MSYTRILLKLSGELLGEPRGERFTASKLEHYVGEIAGAQALGVKIALVIGGGNLCRGQEISGLGPSRTACDQMGMMATMTNSLLLRGALEKAGLPVTLMSRIALPHICAPYQRQEALKKMEQGDILILGGGLGLPYFTTDTASVVAALELGVDLLVKGTSVEGVYLDYAKKEPMGEPVPKLTLREAFKRELAFMDLTALALCQTEGLPVVVYNVRRRGALVRLLQGEALGTYLAPGPRKA